MVSRKIIVSLGVLFFSGSILAAVPVVESAKPVEANSFSKMTKVPDVAPSDSQLILSRMKQLQEHVADLRRLVIAQGQEIQRLKEHNAGNNIAPATQPKQTTVTPTEGGVQSNVGAPASQLPLPTAIDPKEVSAYQSALSLIKTKQYSDAIKEFKEYLERYLNGKYRANAHYWLGQLFMISGDNEDAKMHFTTVVNEFPKSIKVADSLLQLGTLAYNRLQFQDAKNWWEKVVNQYPNSTAARLAEKHLDDLKKAGN